MSWRNGLAKHARELRFIVGKSKESKGIREFLKKQYIPMKKANPSFPLLVREGDDALPAVLARYAYGKEEVISANNMTAQQVESAVERLVKEVPKAVDNATV
mmetsp:Transcript_11860/g.17685  ORF Transcript_11860/g.17685 Transcript_11860/m.17685 type:complete len:102 (-) Transcript_11860:72-377(-)